MSHLALTPDIASSAHYTVPPGSSMGLAPAPQAPTAGPAAKPAPGEIELPVPAPSTRSPPSSQAAPELPDRPDLSLADPQALCSRLKAQSPERLAEHLGEFTVLHQTFRVSLGAQASDASLQADDSGPAKVATPAVLPMSEEVFGADALTQLIALFMMVQAEMGRVMTTLRSNAIAEKLSLIKESAEKLRDAADETMKAALIQGATGIAAGAFQVGMATAALGQTAQAAQASKQAAKLEAAGSNGDPICVVADNDPPSSPAALAPDYKAQAADYKAQAADHSSQAQSYNAIGAGMGGVMSGVGTLASAFSNREAQRLQADSKVLDAGAVKADGTISDAQALYQQTVSAAAAVLQTLVGLLQADVQGKRSAYMA